MQLVRCDIIEGDCIEYLKTTNDRFDLSFVDPPFNQGKEYENHYDDLLPEKYWEWMQRVCELIFEHTSQGGAIYFMQREKNTKYVLDTLDKTGWTFQNLIIWKKKASAVPCNERYGKHYQIIAFYTKGKKPRVFNKLRINPPLLVTEKYARPTGMFVTDLWDDIRELTSGYFAGEEPLRFDNGDRAHKQQSPIRLLLRIILSSSKIGDTIFDPYAGTGTTLTVAKQLERNSIGVELSQKNVEMIKKRLLRIRDSDDITVARKDYEYTNNLNEIWPGNKEPKLVSLEKYDAKEL